MKILVTGAAGAIGSHLVEKLVEEGHEVIGVDALTDYYDPRIKKITSKTLEDKGAEMHHIDIVSGDIASLAQDVDFVFHLAAQPGISSTTSFDDYLRNNIVATQKVLEAVKSNSNLKAFFNASTSSVYGKYANGPEADLPQPTSYYGVTKLAAEQLALSYFRDKSLPVVNLRFFSVYGERERPEKFFHKLIKSLHEDSEITMYEGSEDHVRSYSYIGDIIDGCMGAFKNYDQILGETFNLGNDKTNTTGEGLRIVEELMGKKAKIKIAPKRQGDQIETGAKIDKARKILGLNPKTDLRTGLKKEIDWYKEFIHGKF